MTLAELRAMKEKSDGMLETLSNDRKVMFDARKEQIQDNTKDFQEFIDSLREYAKLLPDEDVNGVHISLYVKPIPTRELFEKFTEHHNHGFWWEDTYCSASPYYKRIHICCSNGDEYYALNIDTEKAELDIAKSRAHEYAEYFKRFCIEHKEEIRSYVERITQAYIEESIRANKEYNDSLYSSIEKLGKE